MLPRRRMKSADGPSYDRTVTSEFDIFSLNPATCALNWRTHEHYPGALLPVHRGATYLNGMVVLGL